MDGRSLSGGLDPALVEFLNGSLAEPFVPAEPRVRRRRLVERLEADLDAGRLVTLIAAAGSGVSSLLADLAATRRGAGADVRRVSLAGIPSCELADALREVFRALEGRVASAAPLLLLLDDLERLEEYDAQDCARLLRLMSQRYPVACGLRPGADLLAECVGDHACYDAQALAVRYDEAPGWIGSAKEGGLKGFMARTGGIVGLAEAQWLDARAGRSGADSEFERCRSRLLLDACLGALVGEERRLRSTMALLGRGTAQDLRDLGLAVTPELMESTRLEARVLGVSQGGTEFCVAGGPGVPGDCVAALARALPDTVRSVCGWLAQEGEMLRAVGLAAGASGALELCDVLGPWAVEAFDGGAGPLLSGWAEAAGPADEGALCAAAVGAAEHREALRQAWLLRASKDARLVAQGRQLQAWTSLRSQWVVLNGASEAPVPSPSRVSRSRAPWERTADALEAHWAAREALAQGEPTTALRYIAPYRSLGTPERLSCALLEVDAYLCKAACGEEPSPEEEARCEQALALLGESGDQRLAQEERVVVLTAQAALGRCAAPRALDEPLACAVGCGDRLVRGTVLVASALTSLLAGRPQSARADAREATRIVRGSRVPALQEAAALTAAVADLLLGQVPAVPSAVVASDLALLGRVLVYAATPGAERPRGEVAVPQALALTLLGVALERQGPAADRLWRGLPASWREAFRERALRPQGVERPRQLHLSVPRSGPGSGSGLEGRAPRLQIQLLGSLAFRLNGVVIDPSAFRRSAARDLLALLAVRNGHAASRVELAAELWPGRTLRQSKGNLSSAISCARRALGEREYSRRQVLTTNELVALNPDLVSCDVDELEELLERVGSAATPDEDRVTLCDRARSLYKEGSYVPLKAGAAGELALYHHWLEARYVEGLVAGSRAAGRLGRDREALLLAQEAQALAPALEDAVERLMEALLALGRNRQAADVYMGLLQPSDGGSPPPPSRRLRELFARACDERGEAVA